MTKQAIIFYVNVKQFVMLQKQKAPMPEHGSLFYFKKTSYSCG